MKWFTGMIEMKEVKNVFGNVKLATRIIKPIEPTKPKNQKQGKGKGKNKNKSQDDEEEKIGGGKFEYDDPIYEKYKNVLK
jgi:hypothetical protein